MNAFLITHARVAFLISISAALLSASYVHAHSTTALQGRVTDPNGEAIRDAIIEVSSVNIGIERIAHTDEDGLYQVAALPAGNYHLEVQARGFRTAVLPKLTVEVARIVTQDFQLQIGNVSEEVTVESEGQLIERATVSVGHVINQRIPDR